MQKLLTTLVLYQKQLFRQSTDGHMITEQINKIKNKKMKKRKR